MTQARTRLLLTALAAGALLAGCAVPDRQSALDPAGEQAGRIHGLWSLYLGVCVVVYAVVMGFVLVGALRRRDATEAAVPTPSAGEERRLGRVVTGAVVATALILFVFLLGDFVTGRGISSLTDPEALTVRLTGHQWWWDVRYEAESPSDTVTTANEVHIPVGRTVRFVLASTDVIHSFWVPNLHGKTDMIPGHTTDTYLRADRPGTFWGQCAEFCGYQHANMRLVVVAEPEDDFNAWLAAQRQPAPEPTTDTQKRGQQVFLTRSCVLCHTISGTPAQARGGPDLSHVAGRQRIAAGTLPNTRGHLAGWVADAQAVKPGVRMPPNPLAPDELQALLDYLEGLK